MPGPTAVEGTLSIWYNKQIDPDWKDPQQE
jgi:hypothetical protein